jgi:O-antigen biosynthesis protein
MPQTARFCPLPDTGPRPATRLQGYSWQARELLARALQARAQGHIVTVFCLAPSLRRHQLRFLPEGIWWQSGGIWGRSARERSALIAQGLHARAAQESRRLAPFRPI